MNLGHTEMTPERFAAGSSLEERLSAIHGAKPLGTWLLACAVFQWAYLQPLPFGWLTRGKVAAFFVQDLEGDAITLSVAVAADRPWSPDHPFRPHLRWPELAPWIPGREPLGRLIEWSRQPRPEWAEAPESPEVLISPTWRDRVREDRSTVIEWAVDRVDSVMAKGCP